MARFNIIDATTGSVKYSGTPRYNGTYCKPSYIEFAEISSPTPIDWKVRDYVAYTRTGLAYRLYDLPQPKKQSRRTEYGGAFVYQNVQFYADTKWLEITPFRDIVLGDNDIHFSTRESWSVWTNVASLIDRMQAVMDASGSARWSFRLVDATEGTDLYDLLYNNYQDFSISGESVLGGLDKIYEQWGNIGWLHTVENGVNVITVGVPPVRVAGIGADTSDEFLYGRGKGLTSLKKTSTNKDELRTRLFVYGSTRNMIPRYYNNLLPYIKDHDSVDIQHLMIPLSSWGSTDGKKDAAKAYIENNVSTYGVRPDSVYFDGSEQEEIYPSIEKGTIGNLYDAMASGAQYRPNLTKWDRGGRLDEVVSASGITDDGMQSAGGNKYTQVQYTNTQAHSGNEYENFSQYLIENFQLGYSGKVTIDFRGLGATVTDASGVVESLDSTLVASIGGRTVSAPVTWTKSGSAYTLSIPEISFNANANDRLYVSLYVNFRQNRASSPVAFSVISRSASIQYATNYANTFVLRVPQIGFDISQRSSLGSQGIATIAMRDGMCGGRSFVVKSCSYNSTADAWDLTVYRGKDSSLDMLFPNTTYTISSGDHFAILDISMPEVYIGIAERRLLAAGQALLEDISRVKPFYEPEINSEYVYANSLALREGWYMPIKDVDITGGLTEYILIDTLTINEGESNIPTYKVTLREQKRKGYSSTGTSNSNNLTSLAGGSNNTESKQGGLVSIGLEMPQQFSVDGSPVAGAGTIVVTLDPNYTIPTAEIMTSLASLLDYFRIVDIQGKSLPALMVNKEMFSGFFTEGFLSGNGASSENGGGGASLLRELLDVFGNSTSVLRADGTAAQNGDVFVYNTSKHKWVAISQSSIVPSIDLSEYLKKTEASSTYQTIINATHRLAASLISGLAAVATSGSLSDLADADNLKAIEALTETSGFLKKTAANTWTLDTNTYLTAVTSQMVEAALTAQQKNALNSGITRNLVDKIQDHDTSIDDLEDRMDVVEPALATAEDDIDDLQTRMHSAELDIDGAQGDITNIETELNRVATLADKFESWFGFDASKNMLYVKNGSGSAGAPANRGLFAYGALSGNGASINSEGGGGGGGGGGDLPHVFLTEAEYEALAIKDPDTLYFTYED